MRRLPAFFLPPSSLPGAGGVHAAGWVANHDGNVSVRLTGSRFLITPTAVSKRDVDDAMLLVVAGIPQALIEVFFAKPDWGEVAAGLRPSLHQPSFSM